jgi:hypothetical protein
MRLTPVVWIVILPHHWNRLIILFLPGWRVFGGLNCDSATSLDSSRHPLPFWVARIWWLGLVWRQFTLFFFLLFLSRIVCWSCKETFNFDMFVFFQFFLKHLISCNFYGEFKPNSFNFYFFHCFFHWLFFLSISSFNICLIKNLVSWCFWVYL